LEEIDVFASSFSAAVAARGYGLHPEFSKRLPKMDADKINALNADQNELQQRRNNALARQQRESERKAILCTLVESERQADHLRAWIARQELQLKPEANGELSRMLRWANDELRALDLVSEPVQLAATLRRKDLFPEVDKLTDPLGDPPPRQPWGR
jgi:hypothetical protein